MIKSFNYTITEDEHKLDANYIIPEDAKIEIKSLYFPAKNPNLLFGISKKSKNDRKMEEVFNINFFFPIIFNINFPFNLDFRKSKEFITIKSCRKTKQK